MTDKILRKRRINTHPIRVNTGSALTQREMDEHTLYPRQYCVNPGKEIDEHTSYPRQYCVMRFAGPCYTTSCLIKLIA